MPTHTEIATQLTLQILKKTGVQAWDDAELLLKITNAANFMAANLIYGSGAIMALPDYFKISPGTALTLKSSGGDAVLTLAPSSVGLPNGSARQSATLDLGSAWAQAWRCDTEFELAATPTAGNLISLYGSFGNATGAGKGNTSGSDAAYTGYSSNIDESIKHLRYLGDHVCTVQAASTVQKGAGFIFYPSGRYLNTVVYNNSGAAFHTSDTNCLIRFTPLEQSVQDAV